MSIMDNVFSKMISKIGISGFKKESKQKTSSLLKELFDNPDIFKLEAFIEDDEIIVKIKKRNDKKQEES